MMVSVATWTLLLACAFGAEVIGTMAGFGAATILTPVAALFMDVKTAIAIVACFHLFGNASRLVFFGRQINWNIWLQFGLAGLLCSLAGAAVTARLPSFLVKLSLGLFLLLYVVLSVLPATRRLQFAQYACHAPWWWGAFRVCRRADWNRRSYSISLSAGIWAPEGGLHWNLSRHRVARRCDSAARLSCRRVHRAQPAARRDQPDGCGV